MGQAVIIFSTLDSLLKSRTLVHSRLRWLLMKIISHLVVVFRSTKKFLFLLNNNNSSKRKKRKSSQLLLQLFLIRRLDIQMNCYLKME